MLASTIHVPAAALSDVCRAKLQEEIRNLERAKNDMQVEESFLGDKFRQMKGEVCAL
jgi:hypothetical protein